MSAFPHGTLPFVVPSSPGLVLLKVAWRLLGTQWLLELKLPKVLGAPDHADRAPDCHHPGSERQGPVGRHWNKEEFSTASQGERINCFIAETSFEGSETTAS